MDITRSFGQTVTLSAGRPKRPTRQRSVRSATPCERWAGIASSVRSPWCSPSRTSNCSMSHSNRASAPIQYSSNQYVGFESFSSPSLDRFSGELGIESGSATRISNRHAVGGGVLPVLSEGFRELYTQVGFIVRLATERLNHPILFIGYRLVFTDWNAINSSFDIA